MADFLETLYDSILETKKSFESSQNDFKDEIVNYIREVLKRVPKRHICFWNDYRTIKDWNGDTMDFYSLTLGGHEPEIEGYTYNENGGWTQNYVCELSLESLLVVAQALSEKVDRIKLHKYKFVQIYKNGIDTLDDLTDDEMKLIDMKTIIGWMENDGQGYVSLQICGDKSDAELIVEEMNKLDKHSSDKWFVNTTDKDIVFPYIEGRDYIKQ